MPKESHLELKVGAMVILAFFCLTVFILSVGDFALFERGKRLRVIFGFASGIKKASPVRVAGVETGMVKEVNLFFDEKAGKTKVELVVRLDQEASIPADSTAMINQLGLLGEKYLEIIPGTEQEHFLKDGDTIMGKDPIIQEEISQRIVDVAAKVEEGIDGISQMVGEDNQSSLKMTLQQISSLSERIDRIAAQIETGKGTIGRLIYDDRLYDDLHGLAAELRANPWRLLHKPKDK